jgi:hypothetical protein
LKLKQWDLIWIYALFHLPEQLFIDLTVPQVDDAIHPSCDKRRSSEDIFVSYFDMEANDLLSSQQLQLNELLVENKELFVTKENPKLGLIFIVSSKRLNSPSCLFLCKVIVSVVGFMTLIGTILLGETVDKHLATSNPFFVTIELPE